MSAPVVNVPLLREVLTHVTEHPEEHDQSVWGRKTACGTAMCVAGHTVAMSGLKIDWSTGYVFRLVDGRHIDDTAAELLGIENDDDSAGEHLFDEGNSLSDLWRIAGELTDGEIEPPASVVPAVSPEESK